MGGLRILHVTPYFAGSWAYGGIPRVAAALAGGLAARGHHVTVYTTDAGDARSRCPRHEVAGVAVHVFPNVSNWAAYHRQLFLPRGLSAYLRANARAFDVAHLHACHNVPAVLAARHLRRAGVPYVVAPNGTAPRIERRRLAKAMFDATVGRRLLPGAGRVLAVTNAERHQLEACGVSPPAIRIVPNPVDTAEVDALPSPAARPADGPPTILYLGKLTPRKNVDVLLHAFAALPATARLVVAGSDMGTLPSVRRLAGHLGLGDRVAFPGLLAGGARLEALRRATVVAYPGEQEIFGLVAMESLLCGTPVVVANDSGCGEIVRAVGGGLAVPPRDVHALGDALAGIVAQGASARDGAAAAGAEVRRRFDTAVVCGVLEAVYRELT